MDTEDYQSVGIMKSSPWPMENTLKSQGFPLRAAILSLVLHALAAAVLAPGFAVTADSIPSSPVLQAVLRPLPPAGETPAAEPEVSAPPARARRAATGPPRYAASVAVPPAPTFPGMPVGEHAPPAHAAADASVSHAAPGHVASLLPAPDERGLDAAGVRQFRLSLASEARRFRRYPEAARQAGLSGTAEVRISVAPGGWVRHADLSRSSGHALLDAAALEMLQQAAMRAVLPESLREPGFAVLLPVVFAVEE